MSQEAKLSPVDRALLVSTLTYHQRQSSHACSCGWGEDYRQLGRSFPEHQVEVYEQAREAGL